jgi:hypothetical protein
MIVQALQYTSDMKLGHYMKVPPRTLFWGQVAATVVAGTVQLGVQAWMFDNVPDLCNPNQADQCVSSTARSGHRDLTCLCTSFNCANFEVFYVASVVWGAIGPQRIFSSGQVYQCVLIFTGLRCNRRLMRSFLAAHCSTFSSLALSPPSLAGSRSSGGPAASRATSTSPSFSRARRGSRPRLPSTSYPGPSSASSSTTSSGAATL